MRKKLEVILTLWLLCSGLLNANPVDTEEALQKATQFLMQKATTAASRRMAPYRPAQLRLAQERTTAEGQPAFYIFNNEAGGFVIVGGDDRAEEILGYSDYGRFDADDMPDALKDLLNGYEEQIGYAVSHHPRNNAPRRASSQWADIEPMVQTHWDQDEPYNSLCPIDPGDGKRSITGCVATAVAQLLYYHRWPETGYGSTSYTWRGETLRADFTDARFDYDKMKPAYSHGSADEDQAVATLMYYCAMAAHADFTSSSTSGWISTSDFRRLFGFKEAKWMELSSSTLSTFENTIYNELQQKRPVLFSSTDPEKYGHLMIIDGCQSGGYFHINFGWSGDKDGYYKLTAIDTGWYNFTTGQDIIYNLEPDYSAPLEAGVYPQDSYQLSDDGTTLVKWTGDESCIHLGADAALWGVTKIGDGAFEDCAGLEAVFIPGRVTSTGASIFKGCTSLTSITVDGGNEYFHVTNGMLTDRYERVRASVAQTSLIIPGQVTTLESQAFSNSTGLKQITLLKTASPPYLYDDSFNADIDFSAITLYVPQESLAMYRHDWFWGKFENIVGISEPVSKKLIVETTTGQTREFMLYQTPVLKNNGATLELTTGLGQTVSYELSKLQKMTFKDTPQLGDPDGRGGVDVADVAALVSHLKGKTPTGFDRLAADVNQDGRVDGNDVDALAAAVIGRREALARQDGQTAALGTEPAGQSPDDAAMYIYLNDGSRLKAFLMSQVAHVSYSCTGPDGITHDMPVVQLVQTRDSLYRIPIAAIDSINYQTPEPVMKKGLFIIDETNIGSVASVDFDGYTITFKPGTASLPKQGQTIYSDLEDDPLPMGFSGRVTKAEGNTFTWESAGPEDVYDRLLVVGRIEPGGSSNSSARRFMPRRRNHAEPTYNISKSIGDFVSISGNGQLVIDYTFDLNAFSREPAMFDMTMKHEITTELKVGYKASNVTGVFNSPYAPDEKVKEVWGWPVELLSAGPIHIDVNSGIYFSYGGDFSVELSGLKYKHTDIREYSWRSDNPLHIEHKKVYSDGGWCDLNDNAKFKAEIAAKVSFGACAELAAVLWKPNWMSLALVFKAGPELKGSISLDTDLLKSDSYATAMYKEFSENVKFTLGCKLGVDLQASYKKNTWTIASASTTLFPKTVTLLPKLSKPALPKIIQTGQNSYYTETSYDWDPVDPMNVKTKATNITLFPGPIGLAVYDAKGNGLFNQFAEGFDNWHWIYASTFQVPVGQYSGQTVKVYPQFKLLGIIPLRGEPAEIAIPKPLALAAGTVSVKEDESAKVDIDGGWGYYSLDNTDKSIASAAIKKRPDGTQYLNISGFKAGSATVTVKDVRSKRTQTCSVTVTPAPIKLSATDIKMQAGQTKTVTASPKAAYTAESKDPDIASVTAELLNNSGPSSLLSVFQITAHKAGSTTITVTDPVRCRTAAIAVEVEPLGGDDDYTTGICSNRFPEDGSAVGTTYAYVGSLITMPWNGEFVGNITVSDKPDMSHKVKSVNISGNGSYGNTYSWFSTTVMNLQPATKYYWQISYFDFETGTYRNCSPVWSFTTATD